MKQLEQHSSLSLQTSIKELKQIISANFNIRVQHCLRRSPFESVLLQRLPDPLPHLALVAVDGRAVKVTVANLVFKVHVLGCNDKGKNV